MENLWITFTSRQRASWLFYGGGTSVLIAQWVGSLTITASTFAAAMAVMLAIHAAGLLRISKEGELHGLDLHEHGISAYREYVISQVGRPGAALPEGARQSVL